MICEQCTKDKCIKVTQQTSQLSDKQPGISFIEIVPQSEKNFEEKMQTAKRPFSVLAHIQSGPKTGPFFKVL